MIFSGTPLGTAMRQMFASEVIFTKASRDGWLEEIAGRIPSAVSGIGCACPPLAGMRCRLQSLPLASLAE